VGPACDRATCDRLLDPPHWIYLACLPIELHPKIDQIAERLSPALSPKLESRMRNFGILFVVAIVLAFGFAMLRHYHVVSYQTIGLGISMT
jgi:hypothetical protein